MATAALVEAPRAVEPGGILVVPGTRAGCGGTVVVAAIDDDTGAAPVLLYARQQAEQRTVPLRVVHVWAEHPWGIAGRSTVRHGEMSDADHLLSDSIADYLPRDEIGAVERQILHACDPVPALVALSREAVLLVVATGAHAGHVGSTALRLAGRTLCPLAIVPAASVTSGRW